MLANSLSTLPAFFAFLAVALGILGVFIALYVRITPYAEFALIREGNAAAAVSLSGTLMGFALPVAEVIRNTRALSDLAVWATIACLVQMLAYLVTRLTLPGLARDIPAGKTASAIFLAGVSIAVGLVNAACMVF